MLFKIVKYTLASIAMTTVMVFGCTLDSPADYPDKREVQWAPVTHAFPGYVTEVSPAKDGTNYAVVTVNVSGEAYCFFGDAYEVGQQVTVVLNNNGTPYNKYDDRVVDCY